MIDLHCHVIPGIDDGAPDMDTALKMAERAREDGITAMVATPHIDNATIQTSHLTRILTRFELLRAQLVQRNIAVDLFLGAEVYFDELILDNLSKYRDIITINNSRYVLVEFPMNLIYPGSADYFATMVKEGYVPVICHPERNVPIQRDPAILHRFLQRGCRVQLNAGSLRGDFGSAALHAGFLFLKKNWVHVIASDAHDRQDRAPELSFLRTLTLGISNDHLRQLTCDIPLDIIHNRDLPPPGPVKEPRRRLLKFLSPSNHNKEPSP